MNTTFRKLILFFFIFFCFAETYANETKTNDRWLEIDVNWFNPDRIEEQSVEFFDRLEPLLNGDGDVGVLINPSWLIDFVVEFNGDLNQRLPFNSSKFKRWNENTYGDFYKLIQALKNEAAKRNIENFKVGVFMTAKDKMVGGDAENGIYDLYGKWSARHPEAFTKGVVIPHQKLKADNYKYASMPLGIKEGTSFAQFFGQQWGAVSKALQLDIINLRDSFAGTKCYSRGGVFGRKSSPDPAKNQEWIDGYLELYREVKTANPKAIVMGYSSGASAVGEFRVNTFDLEKLVADGYIDVFVSQSWAGAWEEWWLHARLGWTFQLSYILGNKLQVAAGNEKRKGKPCKHLVLTGLMDGWEPWDIIHSVPDKIAWSIWAYNMAAIKTPNGLKTSDGNYISWVNNPYGKLLSAQDVDFLSKHFDAAEACAKQLQETYGTSFVYNRSMMEWLQENDPASNNTEWIDEQSAMLMKWGMPVLSATRTEWLPDLPNKKGAWLVQLPGQLNKKEQDAITSLSNNNQPVCYIGRADRIEPQLLENAGIVATDELIPKEDLECYGVYDFPGLPHRSIIVMPDHFKVETKSAKELVYTPHSPLLSQNTDNNVFYWQPNDWRNPLLSSLNRNDFGSETPHVILNKEWNEACRANQLTSIEPVPSMLPVPFHYWKSGDKNYLLFGNLETRVIGDSRTPRYVTLYLNHKELHITEKDIQLTDLFSNKQLKPVSTNNDESTFEIEISPNGLRLFTIGSARN
jgi:hypothetical protein